MGVRVLPRSFMGKASLGLAILLIVVLAIAAALFFMPHAEPLFMVLAQSEGWLMALASGVVLIAILGMGTIASGLFSIVKRGERFIMVFAAMLISLVGLSLLAVFLWGSPHRVSDAEFLEFFLADHATKGRYNVFNSELSLPVWWDQTDNLSAWFRQAGLPLDSLVARLLAANQTPRLLNIPSSPERGYVIDYRAAFRTYFEKDGGGWIQLRQENPQVQAMVSLSAPAYDSRTGLVMIYVGWQADGLMGEGEVLVYKYVFGRMIFVTSLTVWIS